MKISILIFLTLSVIIAVSACYYDSQEYLFPGIYNCDTSNVTYTASIVPIIENNCLACHYRNSPPELGGNIHLEDYQDIYVLAKKDLNQRSRLLNAVNHVQGYFPMPYPVGTPKLDSCKIQTIRIWIDAGALNN